MSELKVNVVYDKRGKALVSLDDYSDANLTIFELQSRLTRTEAALAEAVIALSFYSQEWQSDIGDLNYDLSLDVGTKARETIKSISKLREGKEG